MRARATVFARVLLDWYKPEHLMQFICIKVWAMSMQSFIAGWVFSCCCCCNMLYTFFHSISFYFVAIKFFPVCVCARRFFMFFYFAIHFYFCISLLVYCSLFSSSALDWSCCSFSFFRSLFILSELCNLFIALCVKINLCAQHQAQPPGNRRKNNEKNGRAKKSTKWMSAAASVAGLAKRYMARAHIHDMAF